MTTTMISIRRAFASFLLALLATAAQAAPPMPRGVSGNFYNPAQSGHGVNIEILDENRAIVYWNVYDHAGNPMPLYAEGRIQENTVRGSAYAPHGMRFGSFNRADLQVPYWGEIELVFQSCARATLKYQSAAGFGTGEMPLQRLASTAECRGGHLLASGILSGTINYGYRATGAVNGVVMPEGTLWATVPTVRDVDGYGFKIDTSTHVLVAPQASGTPERVLSEARLMPNGFLCELAGHDCVDRVPEGILLEFAPSSDGMTASVPSDGAMMRVQIGTYLPGSETLRGTFEFDALGARPGLYQMVLGQGGTLCVRVFRTTPCLYTGTISQTGYEPYTFVLQRAGGGKPWRGVIITDFTQVFIGPYRLRFIGTNGETGLALTARADLRQ